MIVLRRGDVTKLLRYVLKEKGLRSAVKALQGINLVYKVEDKNEKRKEKKKTD